MICESTDFAFPMTADVFYSSVEQGQYGAVQKQWSLYKSTPCYFAAGGIKNKEEQQTGSVAVIVDKILAGRVPTDIRFNDMSNGVALTNLLITNIVDGEGNPIYVETGGVRAGKSTLFEIVTLSPFSGLFGKTEYYRVILKRSDNQGTDI